MASFTLDSRQLPAPVFHFDICGGIAACAFAAALILCVQHGDFSAIPGLLGLTAMTAVVFGVMPPAVPGRRGRAGRETCFRTHLLRRHCLEQ